VLLGASPRWRARAQAEVAPAPAERSGAPPVLLAVHALSARDREILMLVAWDGLSVDEAATALGCSRGAAKVRFHRAKRRLARALAELEQEDVATAVRLGVETR
jgi:RNA polymerase sigma-70 factor (ECF subfamily)